MTTLRLLSWNVRHLLGDPLAVHRVLRAAAPDLVCLQEAPRLPWSRFQLGSTARAGGLIPVAGGWSGAGTAILRSPRVRVDRAVAFTFAWAGGRAVRRGAVLADIELADTCLPDAGLSDTGLSGAPAGGVVFRVACVHLGLDAAERLAHIQELRARLATAGSAVAELHLIVAGDLNEPPSGPAWQAFSPVVTDPAPHAGPTYPASRPRRRIDAVLTSPGIDVVEYDTWHPTPRDAALASDHLPILALLRERRNS